MTVGILKSILTPAGVVEIGDVITIDLSNDPVARNYNWPKKVNGKVFEAHDNALHVALDLPKPKHLTTLGADVPFSFVLRLSKETAELVVKVKKP